MERPGFHIGPHYFFWDWPEQGMGWFLWGFQCTGSRWKAWRIGPFSYHKKLPAYKEPDWVDADLSDDAPFR